jgi:O-antigen/teichoic acid export membrane protein
MTAAFLDEQDRATMGSARRPGPELLAPAQPPARASLARAGLLLGAAMGAGNALNYAYNLVMVRRLGPAGYGALAALLALLLIGAFPGMALQVVVARHTALCGRDERALAALWTRTLAATLAVGAVLGLLGVLGAPAVRGFLHLGSLAPALWLAAALAPLPAVAALQGMLQGRERFGALAAVLLVAAAGKLAAGMALVALGGGVAGALAGAAIGGALALLTGVALVRSRLARWRGSRLAGVALREVLAASAAILGLLLLTNLDVLLARHHLSSRAAGLYAAGAVMAKIAFWAPQFVIMVVFPRLVAPEGRARLLGRAAAVVAAGGALLMAGAALAPRLAVLLPFGSEYLEVGPLLPAFAALGTLLALAELVLFSGIAAGDRRSSHLLLAAALAEAALIQLALHRSTAQIVAVALGTAAALLAAGWALERHRARAAHQPVSS